MTKHHDLYNLALRDKKFYPVIAYGSAGTGKTFGACQAAYEYLVTKEVEQIIVTRPNVSFADKNGFLPGTEREKMEPWIKPVLQHFQKFAKQGQLDAWEEKGKLQFLPLETIQGLTFDRSFIIIDEVQNLTFKQLMVFLQRTGEWSKVVMCGDVAQISPRFQNSGLKEFLDMLNHFNLPVHQIEFTREDIVRSGICKMFVEAEEDWEVYKNEKDKI